MSAIPHGSPCIFFSPSSQQSPSSLRHLESSVYCDHLYIGVPALLVRCLLLWLHEIPKWYVLTPEVQLYVREEATYGFWKRHCAFWVRPTVAKAFTQSTFVEDLTKLPQDLTAGKLLTTFEPLWAKYENCGRRLVKAYLSMHKLALFKLATATLFIIACNTGWPFLAESLAKHLLMLQNKHQSNKMTKSSVDICIIAATLCLTLFLSQTFRTYYKSYIRASVRGTTTAAIFKKLSMLSDKMSSEHAKLSLVKSNIESIVDSSVLVDDIWSLPVNLIVLLLLLWGDLGPNLFSMIIFSSFAATLSSNWGEESVEAYKTLAEKTESRSALLNMSLRNLKSIRMTRRGPILTNMLKDRLKEEVTAYNTTWWHGTKKDFLMVPCRAMLFYFALSNYYNDYSGYQPDATSIFRVFGLTEAYVICVAQILNLPQRIRIASASLATVENFLMLPDSLPNPPGDEPQAQHPQTTSIIEFREASLAATPAGEAILTDISVSITRGKMAIITGRQGSGKSTLMLSITSRTTVLEGELKVREQAVAYCGQNTWLQGQSIKDNIIGFEQFEETWYREVKAACLLVDDISNLPGGDDYVIASSGADLSEAQRQRLALARAVYSRAKLFILDDCLGAQDSVIAFHLNSRLFGRNGLLTRSATVLLSMTDPTPYMSSGRQFFLIDNLREVNQVSRQQALASIALNQANATESSPQDHAAHPERFQNSAHLNNHSKDITHQVLRTTPLSLTFTKAPYSFYMKNIDIRVLAVCVALLVLTTALEQSVELCISIYFNEESPRVIPISLYIAATALSGATIAASRLLSANITAKHSSLSLFGKVLDGLSRVSLNPAKLRSITSTASASQEVSINGIHRAVMTSIYWLSHILLRYIMMCTLVPWLIVVMLALGFVSWAIFRAFSTIGPRIHNLQLQSDQSICSRFADIATGISHLHAFEWRERAEKATQDQINQKQAIAYYDAALDRWVRVAMGMFLCAATALCVPLAIAFDFPPFRSALVVVFLYPSSEIMASTLQILRHMDIALATAGQMKVVTDTRPPRQYADDQMTPEWPENGHIEIQNAVIHYHESEDTPALRNVSVTVNAGRRLGLYGPAGSGKSAVPLALLNLPRVYHDRWPGKRPVLIPGTVRQNLMPEEFTEEPEDPELALLPLEHILDRLELWDSLEEQGGVTTDISKIVFSEDQWQRFSVAQALSVHLYQQNKIVIINNVTSHASEASRAVMLEVMNEIFGKCTQIITGHMPSAVRNAHSYFVVRNGRVISQAEATATLDAAVAANGAPPPPTAGSSSTTQATGSQPRLSTQSQQPAAASGPRPRQTQQTAGASGSQNARAFSSSSSLGIRTQAQQSPGTQTSTSQTQRPVASPTSGNTANPARGPASQSQVPRRDKDPVYTQPSRPSHPQPPQPRPPTAQPRSSASQTKQPVSQPTQPAPQPRQPISQPQQPISQTRPPASQPKPMISQSQQPISQPQQHTSQTEPPAAQPRQPTAQPQPTKQPTLQLQQPPRQPAPQPKPPTAQPQPPAPQSQQPVSQPRQPTAQSQQISQPQQSVAQVQRPAQSAMSPVAARFPPQNPDPFVPDPQTVRDRRHIEQFMTDGYQSGRLPSREVDYSQFVPVSPQGQQPALPQPSTQPSTQTRRPEPPDSASPQ